MSRFDLIVDIKRDIEHAIKTGREMLGPDSGSRLLISDLVLEPWVRELQAMVAILRTDLPEITVPSKVVDYKQEKYDDLTSGVDSDIEYISDFLPRLSQSLKKIIIAICRANARKEATTNDVDYAFRFLQLKLNFLMTVKPEGVGKDGQSSTVIPPEYLISIKFEGKIITLHEAMEYVNSQTENPLGDRQIRRYLNSNFEKAGRGKWKIDKLKS